MINYCSAGWKMTLWNPFLIFFSFLYQFAWGFFLYRFVQSVVVPVLHRYPGKGLPQDLNYIFAAESQFQLMKTDLAASYIWTLALVLGVRMIVTPMLNAGIYDSFQQTYLDRKRSFLKGVKRWSIPFFLLYVLQTAFMLAPLLWLIPWVQPSLAPLLQGNVDSRLSFAVIGYLAYTAIIKLAFMYIQLGLVTRTGWLASVRVLVTRFPAIMALSALILALYALAAAIGWTVSILDAGLFTVLLHQVYHLVKTMFKLWEIGTQHQYYVAKAE